MQAVNPLPVEIKLDINQYAAAEARLCDTCGACLTACPINLATDRLRPRSIVRMINLGLLDELLRLPEIWYCIGCNRCAQVCPMTVKPSTLIAQLKMESARRGIVRRTFVAESGAVFKRLHRVRWHLAKACMNGADLLASGWKKWVKMLPQDFQGTHSEAIRSTTSSGFRKAFREALGSLTNFSSCLTCQECSNACPVCYETRAFDPLRIFRMVTYGFKDELLRSPAIWLCLGCDTCSRTCTQNVQGRVLIRCLQEMAVSEGYVDRFFEYRWKKAQRQAYGTFLAEIDQLLSSGGPN